jgi:hypothetical protein
MTKFNVGDKVKFKDPTHEKYWFLKTSVGHIVEIKDSYRSLKEKMLTARFGDKTVYGASTSFDLVVEDAKDKTKN